jgi:myo-inositol-1(or 4)-monophosphatase
VGGRNDGRDRGGGAGGPGPLSFATDLELAERAARAAGALLLERFGGPARGVERKSTRTDMVSDADRDAEAVIEGILLGERPGDGLLAEEGATSHAESGRTWVVDPLDGTTNFLYGFPAWVVSIALEDADTRAGTGGGAVGVVLDPLRDELFTAVRGEGARLNGERIEVSGREELERALIATGFGYDAARRVRQAKALTRMLLEVRDIRRAGAAALDLCMVIVGRLDGYYERGLQPWDWAAGSVIVREAGGTLIELDGEPPGLVAASPAIAEGLAALA